jgi:tetratricopeptide (TPR) repeat protein
MRNSRCSMASSIGFVVSACILIHASTDLFAQPDPKSQPDPSRNEQLTSEAWKALEKKTFLEAITKADKCIESFEASAVKLQKQLEKDKAKVPKGEVTEEEKKVVHKNGLLNDVATCYFIKGKAHEGLKEKDAAIAAYKAAAKLTYARTWDPDGPWFWSPAEAATERLEELR